MAREYPMGLATREAYGQTLVKLGHEDPNVVVLDADLSKSTQTHMFGKEFPERFFNAGICEANMVSMASGLALCGKTPFVSSFSVFLIDKSFDQLRMCVAYPGTNVKVVVSHGGISVGEDGPSQQAIEDIALACSLPGFIVNVPADEVATRALVRRAYERRGPVFMRVGRPKAPIIYAASEQFELGKGKRVEVGDDLTIITCGGLLIESLRARDQIEKEFGLRASVVDMHTIKPLDGDLIVAEAQRTGAVLVVEEALADGALSSAVARCLAERLPTLAAFVTLPDTYAESGTPAQLYDKYGLSARGIAAAARKLLDRKATAK
ncbi:MAG: transketolase C-terminal domain-containing protein [Acidobacteriota bacterium]